VTALKIAPALVAGGDANLVGQTVLAALRQATEASRRYREEQRAALTGGLKLPEF
jgi:DNA-binding protein YbaB